MKPLSSRRTAIFNSATVTFLMASGFTCLLCHADFQTNPLQMTLRDHVFDGLLRIVDFFASNYQYVNIDAVFCIQLCQGSLIGILEDCESKRLLCPQEVTRDVKAIIERLQDIVELANPYTEKQGEDYFQTFSELLTAPFNIRYVPENLTSTEEVTRVYNKFEGVKSDACIMNLLGVGDSYSSVPRCTVSHKCWEFMTRPGAGRYYLTHQLLYTMISEQVGCQSELEKHIVLDGGKALRDLQRRFCEQIYFEALFLTRTGVVPTPEQDLLMEQITFCGMLGFQDFFHESWVPKILSWQTEDGCYTNNASVDATGGHRQTRTDGIETQLVGAQEAVDDTKHRRWRRTEKVMLDGCLSHKTGVAISALGAFLRYLVHQLYAHA
ncbi:hypothetical protein BsWGS_21943 [Bradybaena similaris]